MQKIFIVIGICSLLFQSKTFSQDTIQWRSGYYLTWEDFKAAPDNNAPFAARTDCSISYAYNFRDNIFTVSVSSYFNKLRSWSKNKNAGDSMLLMHEQGHFNINEIFARKMRLAFSKYSFNQATVRKDLDGIFQSIWKEKLAYDILYDQQTEHGKNMQQQTDWSNSINKQLLQLSAYK